MPTRMCELLVGLPDVVVLGVEDEPDGELLRPRRVPQRDERSASAAGSRRRVKERPVVSLVDLPCFGRRDAASSGTSAASAVLTSRARGSAGPRRTRASARRAWR